jgi:tRNA (guanine-N7-)-methyltransferase
MANKSYPVSNYRDYTPTRNPYGEKIAELAALAGPSGPATILADHDTEAFKGQWRKRFNLPETARLELELGAYHGETSNHLARKSPDAAHLGVEWTYKMCYMGAKKARDQGLPNVTFLRANNARLPWMVAQGEVDRVWILFPDPWSKSGQGKWRLLQPGFLRMIGALLDEGKELMIKTDHAEYAEFIAESIKEADCFDKMPEERAKQNWSMIPPTPFERIFLRQGLPIHSFGLLRNAKLVVAPEEVQHVLSRA